jgi:predicted DNA-binding transcriptional regulator YafY
VLARLRIDAAVAAAAVHELGPDTVEKRHDDGSVVVAIPVTNRDAFRTFVLGLLEHAEVLGPPELREAVVGWLRDLSAGAA